MRRVVILLGALLPFIISCMALPKGTNLNFDGVASVRHHLRDHYPDCKDVKVIEVFDVQPLEMRVKRVSIGEWVTEKWRVSACGLTEVYLVRFALMEDLASGVSGFIVVVTPAE